MISWRFEKIIWLYFDFIVIWFVQSTKPSKHMQCILICHHQKFRILLFKSSWKCWKSTTVVVSFLFDQPHQSFALEMLLLKLKWEPIQYGWQETRFYSSLSNNCACTIINFLEKNPSCTPLFQTAQLRVHF